MDKLAKCKLLLLTEYFKYVRKLQKGYPLKDYDKLLESMLKLEYLEFANDWEKEVILNNILSRLILFDPFNAE